MTIFTEAEIAFVVRCAGKGMTAREATAELNAKFGSKRIRESLIQVARRYGAPFGHAKVHPPSQRRQATASNARPSFESGRSHRMSTLFVQPPILAGNSAADFKRRDDEPEARGRQGEFSAGCKWIHGDPRSEDWRQCGHRRAIGSAYCLHHRERTIRARINALEEFENKESTQ